MGRSKLNLEEILSRRQQGKTTAEIATEAETSRQSIEKVLRRHQVVPGGAPVTEEALAADVRRQLLKQFTTKTIAKMPMREQLIALKALHPRKRGRVSEEPHVFQEIDLGLIKTIPCASCNLPGGSKSEPVCPLCRPDEVFTSGEPVVVSKYITTRQVKCLTEGCPNVTTNPRPRRGELLGRDGLCNSCRKASPAAMAALTAHLESLGWVSSGGRWVRKGNGNGRELAVTPSKVEEVTDES